MSKYENICYSLLKQMVADIYKEYMVEKNRDQRDKGLIQKLGGSLLAMITYLRQALVIPQIPITRMIEKMIVVNENTKTISDVLTTALTKYDLMDWLNSSESLISTRVKYCLDILLNHLEDSIVISWFW